ncbi:MAG: hypothetical protein AAGH90_11010 [Pseudomonadota bacterium]
MTKKSNTDRYGPALHRLMLMGMTWREARDGAGMPETFSRRAVVSTRYRQKEFLAEDARDLAICAEIDSGMTDSEICNRYDVVPAHVASLRDELEAVDGV